MAKILDFGKFKYEQEKKKQRQKTKKIEIKGIRLTLNMAEHDLEVRKKRCLKFIEQKNNVQIEMTLKGREAAYMGRAFEQCNSFIHSLESHVEITQPISRKGRRMTVVLQPKK